MIGLIETVALMFVYLAVGFVARKTGLITDTSSKSLSKTILCVAQPFMLVNAIMTNEYSKEGLKSFGIVLIIGIIVHAVAAAIAFIAAIRMKDQEERRISEVAMVFANCGFFGFPLVEALYGKQGLFWGAVYVIIFNVAVWTYGLFVLSRAKSSVKMNLVKMVLNFGTVPCILGVVLYLLRITFPPFVMTAISSIGAVCTPLSLIVAGGLIATIPLKRLVSNGKVYYTCFIKLLAVPIVSAVVLKLCGFNDAYVLFGATMASLPTGAIVAMFSETHDIKPNYAAHNVGMSTLLTIGTIPLAIWLVSSFII